VNPSFLVTSPDQRFLYSAHGDEEYATVFAVNHENGTLAVRHRAGTGGRNGVHLAIDPRGRFLIVANYASGNVSVLPVGRMARWRCRPGGPAAGTAGSQPRRAGKLPPSSDSLRSFRALRRRSRQGTGQGLRLPLRFELRRAEPTAQGSVVARSGSGPRHACFHPTLPVLWVLNEINSSLTAYWWDAERGHLRPSQILPSIPFDYTGENTAAEIATSSDGRFVYCSNRGHDSVGLFAANADTGLLTSMAGSRARQNAAIHRVRSIPALSLGANEQSDTIVSWRADPATGRLTPTGQAVRNPSPVTIAFARW